MYIIFLDNGANRNLEYTNSPFTMTATTFNCFGMLNDFFYFSELSNIHITLLTLILLIRHFSQLCQLVSSMHLTANVTSYRAVDSLKQRVIAGGQMVTNGFNSRKTWPFNGSAHAVNTDVTARDTIHWQERRATKLVALREKSPHT